MNRTFKRLPGCFLIIPFGIFFIFVIAGVFLFFFRHPNTPTDTHSIPRVVDGNVSVSYGGSSEMSSATPTVEIQLGEGRAQPQEITPAAPVSGEPLSPTEVESILSRLPTLTPEPGDQTDFNLAQGPIPPPRPGETVPEAFPPPPEEIQPVNVESGPLEVLRYAPEGEIPIAPFINVTFNQPMVPVTALAELSDIRI
jgi:hypothetical protein